MKEADEMDEVQKQAIWWEECDVDLGSVEMHFRLQYMIIK